MACTEMQHRLGMCACGDVDPEDPDDASPHDWQDIRYAPQEDPR